MSNEIFFTIIIPTRERCDTLIHTIKTALAQDYDNYEILVSDNASNDDTELVVKSINHPRIRYINTGQRVSMSENWEFALNHIDKGWVTVLGDDDGLLPHSLKSVEKIINETNISAIRSNGLGYIWPSLSKKSHGSLSVSLSNGYELIDSQNALQSVINGNKHYNELPMLYNGGFIDIELIEKAKKVTGKFFLSMTPDVYSAIVFSFLTDNYVYSHEPLAINGASHHSGGTAGFEKIKIKRTYDPAEKFYSEKNIPFHTDLPLIDGKIVRSIQVIVYEAYLQAKKFHHLKNIKATKEQQLNLIVIKSGPDHNEIMKWAEAFCKIHGIKKINNLNTLFIKIKNILNKIKNLRKIFILTCDEKCLINNIHDAATAAIIIRKIKPNPIWWRLKNSSLNKTSSETKSRHNQ